MAARPAFAALYPKSAAVAGSSRPRRTLTAFLLGAAISAAGLATLVAQGASAHGPFGGAFPGFAMHFEPISDVAPARAAFDEPRHRARREHITLASRRPTAPAGGRQAVCVRLCDGYFFPAPASTGDPAAQTAACDSQCPDAPTEVYYRNGSDGIEGAVSLKGRPYTALPVALRYRKTVDATCTCHREPVAYTPLRDATLRAGDAIMTPAGFLVFRGGAASAHGPGEFAALSAAGLPSATRGALQAMETASLEKIHPSLRGWLAAQATPRLAQAGGERKVARLGRGDEKIRLLVWRGRAED